MLACGERERLRHTEVGDDGVTAIDENVRRLHVAVDHAVRVRVRQRVGDLAHDRDDVGERQPALALEPVLQRLALNEGHREVHEPVLRFAGGEQRDDVRVAERRGESRLPVEALDAQSRRAARAGGPSPPRAGRACVSSATNTRLMPPPASSRSMRKAVPNAACSRSPRSGASRSAAVDGRRLEELGVAVVRREERLHLRRRSSASLPHASATNADRSAGRALDRVGEDRHRSRSTVRR